MDFYYTVYFLMIVAFIFCLYTSVNVKSTYKKYNKVLSSRGVPANVIARQILDSNGLYDVDVMQIPGNLTDNYNPKTNTVSLSQTVFNSTSVGAIGVAAHEVGHAIQYAKGYTPIKIRMSILPVAQFGSHAWMLIFILGLIFSIPILWEVGIALFFFIVLFQLITLPVELDASRRAIKTIESQGLLFGDELKGAKKTLTAAAMTYVAAAAMAVLQLLRLLAMTSRRR
ncbi:MAG: zinc metallopeptidase [Eubacterium sp.]|nr:zinc metallopeptidase [Eubacterium sp.]